MLTKAVSKEGEKTPFSFNSGSYTSLPLINARSSHSSKKATLKTLHTSLGHISFFQPAEGEIHLEQNTPPILSIQTGINDSLFQQQQAVVPLGGEQQPHLRMTVSFWRFR